MRPRRTAAAVVAVFVMAALAGGVTGPDGYFGSGNDEAETIAAQAATA